MVPAAVVQLVVERLAFTCKVHPVEGAGQATTTAFGADRKIRSLGAAGTCTAESAHKPPVSEKFPPVIGPPASCWPMVPLTEYPPPVLVPPPASIVCQSIAYG